MSDNSITERLLRENALWLTKQQWRMQYASAFQKLREARAKDANPEDILRLEDALDALREERHRSG